MNAMHWITRTAAALAAAALVLLGGCGGGSSDGGGVPAPGSQTGSLTLGLAGGAPAGFSHVYVTIEKIALNTDANRPWSPSDSTWQVVHLDAPITVDLTTSVNGLIASLVTGAAMPATTYGQLRVFVLRHDETLAASAKALNLAFNAEADYVDAAGQAHQLPLEFADSTLGLRVNGTITIGANVESNLTLQWDLEHSAVRFASDDGIDRVTMRPDVQVYDIAQTGAIVGLMDKSVFCTAGSSTGCVYDVVATAEMPSADGRFMVAVRSAPVVVSSDYARFGLYPLPPLAAGATFDVVIRGRNMRTIVVRAVPAVPAEVLQATATQLGIDMTDPDHPVPAPIVPQLSAQGDALVTLNAPTVPASAQLVFGQTLPGSGELPHEVKVANTDPFTGRLADALPLPSGPLRVATYTSTSALSFSDVAPQEGTDAYSLLTLGTRYDTPSAIAVVSAPGGATSAVTAPVTMRDGRTEVAPLTVTLAGNSSLNVDAAELVVTDVAGIVTTLDVSSLLGTPNATAPLQLPSGSFAASLGGTAIYAVAVRTWKRSSPSTTLLWARAPSTVDLRVTAPAAVTITLP